MLLKKFYINIWIKVIGIVITCLGMAACFVWKRDYLIIGNIMAALAIQVIVLIQSLNRLNRDLEIFFDAIRSNDTSIIFTQRKKKSAFEGLYKQLEQINKTIQQVKIENQNQNQYFKVLVEHVGVGLLAFKEDGKVTLFNQAASNLLLKTNLYRISELENIQAGLSKIVEALQPGEQRLVSLYRKDELMQLSLKATWIKIMDEQIKLVSLQNIRNELDEKELESWQKLIRVLTHELMNSAGPMSSTIATLNEFITQSNGQPKKANELSDEIVEDIATGLHILDERSQGMVDFVTRFRNLTLLPKPTFTTFGVTDLASSIRILMNEKIRQSNIDFEIKVSPETMLLTADRGMVQQILINLINNAIYALEDTPQPRIWLIAKQDEDERPIIIIADNGKGIPKEIQDKVFIPFFTTRENGSGVGLSLSRQMMRLHGGRLNMTSTPGEMTVFTMKW